MRCCAHFGLRGFILRPGYRGDSIKDYLLRYSEAVSNDSLLTDGGHSPELPSSDTADWRIAFIDNGMHAPAGPRPRAVEKHDGFDEAPRVKCADTLSDAPGLILIEDFSSDTPIYGGHFSFRREISDHIMGGEDLFNEPLSRLIGAGQLTAYPYDGFWAPMDTLQDREGQAQLSEDGELPGALWRSPESVAR